MKFATGGRVAKSGHLLEKLGGAVLVAIGRDVWVVDWHNSQACGCEVRSLRHDA